MTLSQAQLQQFKIDGYLVLPQLLSKVKTDALRDLTFSHLERRIEPFELETELNYPGAPTNLNSEGGATIRRLKGAYSRHNLYHNCAEKTEIIGPIQQILNDETIWLNPNHHNCVMTKHPKYSSETLWHRDTRYWNFSDKYLVNAWFALGDELEANGAMTILPGSHRWDVQDHALDDAQFLKLNHPDNEYRLKTARTVVLERGDVLLFSAHCFHAAGKNSTEQTKLSLVFTYHGSNTKPLHGSNSALHDEIRIDLKPT